MSRATLIVAVQPPSIARRGDVLSPPLALRLQPSPSSNGYDATLNEFDHTFAYAVLLDENGNVVENALAGAAVSAQPLSTDETSPASAEYYCLFDNLIIPNVGRFRIKIVLMQLDRDESPSSTSGGEIASVGDIESNLITVEDHEVPQQQPEDEEQRFLDSLPRGGVANASTPGPNGR